MANRGAQPGNNNAGKGGVYRHALKRALAELADKNGLVPDYEEGLKLVAQQVVNAASGGDLVAANQIGDRFDGKPHQSIDANVAVRNLTPEQIDDELERLIGEQDRGD